MRQHYFKFIYMYLIILYNEKMSQYSTFKILSFIFYKVIHSNSKFLVILLGYLVVKIENSMQTPLIKIALKLILTGNINKIIINCVI